MTSFVYAVGDPTSDERGSGARANGGKPQLDLVPISIWYDIFGQMLRQESKEMQSLAWLVEWQQGDEEALDMIFQQVLCLEDIEAGVSVLEYGVKKYAAWNWAKGMKWSIPVGCFLRHMKAIAEGEYLDPESDCTHWGHCVANLIMLHHFQEYCPDMNDIATDVFSHAWHKQGSFMGVNVTPEGEEPVYDKGARA